MSTELLPPRYLLALARGTQAFPVAESDDRASFLPRINQGGTWTLWERKAAGAYPVMIAHFAVESPITIISAGRASCLEDRWRRSKPDAFRKHRLSPDVVDLAKLDELIAAFREAPATAS